MKQFKKTPLLFVLAALEIFLILSAFYYLVIDNNGGNALGGTIFFIGAIINALLLWIEQSISKIKTISNKQIWTAEIILIAFVIIYITIKGFSIG